MSGPWCMGALRHRQCAHRQWDPNPKPGSPSLCNACAERFYDPVGGEVHLDGVDIRRLQVGRPLLAPPLCPRAPAAAGSRLLRAAATCVVLRRLLAGPSLPLIFSLSPGPAPQLRFLRQQLSLVSQEPTLFAPTIADNIRFG